MGENDIRPLHLHTLESLLSDLVSGRPVLVGAREYVLADDQARSALQWYRQRGQGSWTANVTAAHAEDLVNAAQLNPPEVAPLPARTANAKPTARSSS